MRRLRRDDYDWIEQHPEPADTPVARLAHVLDVFDDTPGDKFVVEATRNLYDDGKVTGLTFGDLRAIAAMLPASTSAAPSEDPAEVRRELASRGHGHVVPRADGLLAKCGGPQLCGTCRSDRDRLAAAEVLRVGTGEAS